LQSLDIQVRSIGEQVPDPLIVYRIGPFRPEEVRRREFDQQVSQWRRIQDAGVIDDGKASQDQ